MSSAKETIQNILTNIDEIKDKLQDNVYLDIVDNLNKLYKEKSNKMYTVTFLTTRFVARNSNSFSSHPEKHKQIILMSDEEYENLQKHLVKTDNFSNITCCQQELVGFRDRLNYTVKHELLGIYNHFDDDNNDVTSHKTELDIFNQVIVTNCVPCE